MASEKSIMLRALDNLRTFRKTEPRDAVPRDRSLNGKARIKARKAMNKQQVSPEKPTTEEEGSNA